MLFLRREGKWDEVSYADMFFTLRDHPEYQIDCGLAPPRDPLVLALEKENKKEGKGKLKRCCSSCSIGQRCTKLGKEKGAEIKDLPEYYKPLVGSRQEESESLEEPEPGSPPHSPVSETGTGEASGGAGSSERGRRAGWGGPVRIKVPFTSFDLETWKSAAKGY